MAHRLALALTGLLMAVAAAPADALIYTVTRTDDPAVGACDADCSLREAVTAANAGLNLDLIRLPAGTYDISAQDTLTVTEPLVIEGAGASATSITGAVGAPVSNMSAGAIRNIGDALTISNLTLTGNTAADGTQLNAGGILNQVGALSVLSSSIAGNTSTGPTEASALAAGGIVGNDNTSVRIENSVVSGNSRADAGTVVAGAIAADSNATLVIEDALFDDNVKSGSGTDAAGGVATNSATATVKRSTFTRNRNTGTATVGAGALHTNLGSAVIEDSTFSGNTQTGVTVNGAGAVAGNVTTLLVERSTISGNSLGAASNPGAGGLVANASGARLVNSTISANSDVLGEGAGGFTNSAGSLIAEFSTIAGNSTNGGEAANLRRAGDDVLRGTIVADGSGGPNCSGAVTSLGGNLETANTCGFTPPADRVGTPAGLAGLAQNGGPTLTQALLAGSAAIDFAGNANCPPTDQRGVARPQDGICDSGAFESGPRPPAQPGGGAGAPAGPAADTARPSASRVSFASRAFRAADRGGSIAGRRRPPVGTRVSYRLSEAATVRFTVERAETGRRVGRRCVRRTPRNRSRRRCNRFVLQRGSFTHAGIQGANSFRFTGRLRNLKLRPAAYRLIAIPTDASGNRGAAIRASFRIVP